MLVFCLLSLVWKQLALIVSDIEKDYQTRTRELKRAINKNSSKFAPPQISAKKHSLLL